MKQGGMMSETNGNEPKSELATTEPFEEQSETISPTPAKKSRNIPPRDNQGHFIKRRNPNQNQNQSAALDLENGERAEVKIEKQESPKAGGLAGLLGVAAQKAIAPDESEKRKPGRPRKNIPATTAQSEDEINGELSTLVISVLTIGIAVAKIPEKLAPNAGELSAVGTYLTHILIRHVPVADVLSPDLLDIVGILATVAGYYGRIAPELKEMKKEKAEEPKQNQVIASRVNPKDNGRINPIAELSPESGAFLDHVAGMGGAVA